jgi:uncharacterized membrane protein YfcA
MTPSEGLTVVTLVVAIISMMLSVIALWPHWKDSMAVVRDGVLWIALIAVVIGVVTGAFKRNQTSPGQSMKTRTSLEENAGQLREMPN